MNNKQLKQLFDFHLIDKITFQDQTKLFKITAPNITQLEVLNKYKKEIDALDNISYYHYENFFKDNLQRLSFIKYKVEIISNYWKLKDFSEYNFYQSKISQTKNNIEKLEERVKFYFKEISKEISYDNKSQKDIEKYLFG